MKIGVIFDLLAAVLGLLMLGVLTWYVMTTSGNHTGVNFKWILYPTYAAIGVYGFLRMAVAQEGFATQLVLLIISVVGIVTVWFLNYFNIMLYYNDWISKGMPSSSF